MSLVNPAYGMTKVQFNEVVNNTSKYMYQTVTNPQVGSIGGEWAVIGLARGNYKVPESYYKRYYANVEAYVKERKGILHPKKYTEYSRLSLALTAIGKDPTNVAGYNLLTPLGDYEKTIWQGINGPIWALIALDSGQYEMPINKQAKTQATRELYVERILKCQLSDGGWSLLSSPNPKQNIGVKADVDITAMALQALAKYQDQETVKRACQKALTCLSKQQNAQGGFVSWGSENAESCAQVIVALTELGIPVTDARFVKNGHTLMDNLMSFYNKNGSFKHTLLGTGVEQMSTEQALYAIVAVQRQLEEETSLYRIKNNLHTKQAVKKPALKQ